MPSTGTWSCALTLHELFLVPLGFAVGAFGTLVGAGGGFVLVPILLLLYPEAEPDTLTAVSLFVVWANATSGTVAYAWQRRIDYRSGIAFAISTLPGAVGGAIVVGYLPRRFFDGLFAGALLVLGTFILTRSGTAHIRPPATGRTLVRRTITDRSGARFVYAFQMWKGVAISICVGFVSSLLGIGGGIIHVPVMATVLRFPIHIAAATSHFVLAFMALEGTGVHFATRTLSWNIWLQRGSLLAAGAVPGAQAGAVLAHRVHGPIIVRALACALLLVGVRLAIQAILE